MDHKVFLRYLSELLSWGIPPIAPQDVPPKLPETTNLVWTNNKNDHSETEAMNTRTTLENKIPPL